MKHEKYTYSQYQINKLKLWIDYLKDNESLLQDRFKKIIDRYSMNNRKNLPTEERSIVELEFFHGSGDLNFSFNAKTIEEEEFNKIYTGYYIVPEYNWYQPQNNRFEYPDSLDIYYEEFREERSESEKWHLTFDWLVKNWVKLGGHKIGLVCGTWQNNAASTFSFNLINWDDCIELPQPESNLVVEYPLIRDLSDFEIETRIRFTNYHPFIQKFRYFEKDQIFFEIAYYANILGYRTGSISKYKEIQFTVIQSEYEYHSMRFEQVRTIAIKADELINQGYEEKPKPEITVNLKKNIVEWEYGPFLRGFEPINNLALEKLESNLGQLLPKQYAWFLERMNKIKPGGYISHFRIKPNHWKKFNRIFNLDELQGEYENLSQIINLNKYLPIATDTSNGYVLINLENEEICYYNSELINTHKNFPSFMMDCTTISEYFIPMRYHLEKDNIRMLRRWISSGIDITDESLFGGRKPLRISRSYEINELLCQHGADANDFHLFSEMGSKYIKMLMNYGLDLKKKLKEQKWFEKVIEENEEYKEISQLLKE